MQVGSVGHSWGTSRLWHDPNYDVGADYRSQPVQRGIMQGEALPKEEHVSPPERASDPYKMQESAYDVAAAQMNRGVDAQKLFHGQKNAVAFDAAVAATRERVVQEDVTRTMISQAQQTSTLAPGAVVQPQEIRPAAPGQVPRPDGASATATEKEANRAAHDAQDVSSVVDAVALAGGGMLSAAASAKVMSAAQVLGTAAQATSAVAATSTGATTATGAANIATHGEDDDGTISGRRH